MSMNGEFVALRPAKLDALIADGAGLTELIFPRDNACWGDTRLSIHWTWYGLHHLLTDGSDDEDGPLAWAVLGGTPFGEDLGYGPARYLLPEEVDEVSAALAGVSRDQLRERYGDGSPLTAAGLYPRSAWTRPETLEELFKELDHLTAFYARAARRNHAVVLFLL